MTERENEWLGVMAVAEELGVEPALVRKWADAPPLDPDHIVCTFHRGADGRKMRRFRRRDVQDWLSRHTR